MNKKIIAVCAGLGLLFGCSSNPEFKNREELEDVVEMRLPNYRVKKYYEDTSFDIHGDYSDSLLIEFDNMPSKAFINEVNKKVEQDKDKDNENKRWYKDAEHKYRFQAMYGEGRRVPKCREGQNDWLIRLEFSDTSKTALIEYYHW